MLFGRFLWVKKKLVICSFSVFLWVMWANHSGSSPKMSNHEQFAKVTHQKWATMSKLLRSLTKNEQITRFFEQIAHLLIFLQKTSNSLRKPGQIFLTLWSNILVKLKSNSKILKHVYQGPRWVQSMEKNRGQKSCDTLPLRNVKHVFTL